jgi:hypothetical protein
MENKMKNKEVLNLGAGLNTLRSELSGRVFAHAVALNQQKIGPFIKSLQEARKLSEGMTKYTEEFEKLKREHAQKDEHDNPAIRMEMDPETGQQAPFYIIPGSEKPDSEFVIAREKLVKKYKEAIDANAAMLKEWHEVLLERDYSR